MEQHGLVSSADGGQRQSARVEGLRLLPNHVYNSPAGASLDAALSCCAFVDTTSPLQLRMHGVVLLPRHYAQKNPRRLFEHVICRHLR